MKTYTAPPMPAAPAAVIARLEHAGFAAHAVGGCVRDTLLGLTPTDWDITTAATPTEVKAVFADCRVIDTGIQHGTVTVLFDGVPFEITTYRLDGKYADNRHPDEVTFTASLLEDVKRRDFTVNAMVWHPAKGITDFFTGREDLKNRVLRTVGDPEQRFSEDALRILRLLRFAATYGLTAEPTTKAAACHLADRLASIAAERIHSELWMLVCGDYATEVLGDYTAVWQTVLPEVKMKAARLWALQALPHLPVYRLAVLLENAPAERVLQRLKADNATIATVLQLIDGISLSPTTSAVALKKALQQYGEQRLLQIITLQKALGDAAAWEQEERALCALLGKKPCYRLRDLQIDGHALQQIGFKGKAIGAMLSLLLDAVIEERCENTPEALIAFVEKNT